MKNTSILVGMILLGSIGTLLAGPLQEARINQIVNDVKVVDPQKGARPAALQDTVRDQIAVRTGIQSRAELLFQDATLTRLGAETFFSFKAGTRDLSLEKGTMLLQVPKGRGGARIRTASVTASITGTTIMIEHAPGKSLKVLVLEGSLRLSANGRFGEALNLKPGKMVIMKPNATKIPDPVDVDLRKVMKTSALIDPALFAGKPGKTVAALPSVSLIEKEIARQDTLLEKQGLVRTNLLIAGAGTNVVLASDETLATLERSVTARRVEAGLSPLAMLTSSQTLPDAGSTNSTNTGSTVATTSPSATTVAPTPTTATVTDPLPGPGPTPTPTPTATPTSTSPSPVTNPLPVTHPAQTLASGTIFRTGGGTPTLVTSSGTFNGTIYGGATIDGPASTFLYGATSAFQAQVDLDGRFGTGGFNLFPTAGVAVYKLSSATLAGSATFDTTGGPVDLALIGLGGIANSGTMNWDLGGIHSLFLGTKNGSLNLGSGSTFSAASGSDLSFLHLLSENGGAGDVTLAGQVLAPDATLLADADRNVNVGATANLTTDRTILSAMKEVRIDGAVSANNVQTWSGTSTILNGNVVADAYYGFATNFTVNGQIDADSIAINASGDFLQGAAGSLVDGADVYLKIGGDLTLNSASTTRTRFDLSGTTQFRAEAGAITLASHFVLPGGATGYLKAGSGGLIGRSFNIGGFDLVQSAGKIDVGSLDAQRLVGGYTVSVTGNLTVGEADVVKWLYASGTIGPRSGDSPSTPHILKAETIQTLGGLDFRGQRGSLTTAPTGGGQATLLTASSLFNGSNGNGINGAKLDGGDAALLSLHAGGDGGTLRVGTDTQPIAGEIQVKAPISATTGANGTAVLTGGTGGNVELISNDKITVGTSIKVSDSATGRASRNGGNITVDSRRTSGTAIQITSSGQLLSLLNSASPGAGGIIRFTSAGGEINVDGTVAAERGTVEMRNTGASGRIALNNASIRGDVVKIGALGADGQLIIGGGTINADTTLKLYGGTTNGQVRFNDNVTLGGAGTKIIAGKSVTIDNGKTVTIGGSAPANVYTSNPNYTGSGGNGSKTGTFGGQGAVTQPLGNRPAF